LTTSAARPVEDAPGAPCDTIASAPGLGDPSPACWQATKIGRNAIFAMRAGVVMIV
jgi:hypothetical protein